MVKTFAKIIIVFLLLLACFFAYIAVRDGWREDRIQTNKGRIRIGMSEAEVISILGEPTSKGISDIPGLYWCYGSDSWKQWEFGENYCGTTLLEMSPDGHVVRLPQ